MALQRNKHKIIHLSQTTSTNSYAKKYIEEHQAGEGTIIVAHEQTSGRGYGENTWESEPGKNLTFSLILYPVFIKAADFFRISQFVSLGLVDVLEKHLSEGISIKWPNDIYYKDDKIAGILIENSILRDKIDSSVIGVGLNVNQEVFAHAPNPVSLKQITGKEYDLEILLEEMVRSILNRYDQMKQDEENTNRNEQMKKVEGMPKQNDHLNKDGGMPPRSDQMNKDREMLPRSDQMNKDREMLPRHNQLNNKGGNRIHMDYIKRIYRIHEYHFFMAGSKRFKARIVDVSSDGTIELQTQNGTIYHFGFKEVEYIV